MLKFLAKPPSKSGG